MSGGSNHGPKTNPSANFLMDKLWTFLAARPPVMILVIVLALVFLPIAVWLDLRRIADDSLNNRAVNLDTIISEIRGYYDRNVIARIQANPDKIQPSSNYHDVAGGVPIPATLSIELGEIIEAKANDIRYRFISDFTFANRIAHSLDEFELNALRTFRESKSDKTSLTEYSGSLFSRQIRMATPVVMSGTCVKCHNAHPESPKKDWELGDIRGIQEVLINEPIVRNLFSFTYLFIYMALAATSGFTFAGLQWRQAQYSRRLNNELEVANAFLSAISIKISKYLPPQIYKSIFSGERDAAISTERKKLTIFFSDIKDFTQSTENLQPEELTQLVNEYFSVMTEIAAEHGATVDKFIGDSVLAFFGDPETLGVREDARNCLKMAIAMQKRLTQLGHEWRARGIERPFATRMGVNTGYCNVGNFGSNDRMDYTIIGAEANLAARLESIAEPGGIVLSYETYVHVKDMIRATPLETISLKGITRKIVPYKMDSVNVTGANDERIVVDEQTANFRIFVDVGALDKAARKSVQRILNEVLKKTRGG